MEILYITSDKASDLICIRIKPNSLSPLPLSDERRSGRFEIPNQECRILSGRKNHLHVWAGDLEVALRDMLLISLLDRLGGSSDDDSGKAGNLEIIGRSEPKPLSRHLTSLR